jgi:hypothetical protein
VADCGPMTGPAYARARPYALPAFAGLLAHLALVALVTPASVDLVHLAGAARALDTHPVEVWGGPQWPYPAGYLPWLWAAGRVVDVTGAPFADVVRVLPALAVAATAVLVGGELSRRGTPTALVVAASATIAAGPAALGVDVWLGQIDAVPAALAVAAILLWDRGGPRRALLAGLVLGLAIAVKHPILVVGAPLLVGIRSPREGAVLVLACAAPAVVLTAPFLLAHAGRVVRAITAYSGVPGIAGPSRLLYGGFMDPVLGTGPFRPAPPWVLRVLDLQAAAVLAGALLVSGLARRAGVASAAGRAAVLWPVVYALMFSFSFQYLLWGLPFLLLARRWALAWGLSALLAFPMLQTLVLGGRTPAPGLYTPLVTLAWLLVVVVAAADLVRLWRAGGAGTTAAAARAVPA